LPWKLDRSTGLNKRANWSVDDAGQYPRIVDAERGGANVVSPNNVAPRCVSHAVLFDIKDRTFVGAVNKPVGP
jgi:hypothetical protein